jgi:hypothetical protein
MIQVVWQVLVPAIVGVVTTLVTLAVNHQLKRRDELLERRREMYDKLLTPYVALIHEIFAEIRNVSPRMKKEFGAIQELSLTLPLYVPDQVFRAFQKVQERGVKFDLGPDSDKERLLVHFYLALGDLVLEIRRDLGYKRTTLKSADIIRNVFRDIDDLVKKHGTSSA